MENLALRQQLAIMKRTTKRPQLHCKDRLFWVFLCRFWRHWREVLIIVKPDTVVRWHKQGFTPLERSFQAINCDLPQSFKVDGLFFCRKSPSKNPVK